MIASRAHRRLRARVGRIGFAWNLITSVTAGLTNSALPVVLCAWLAVAGTAFDGEMTDRTLVCMAWQAYSWANRSCGCPSTLELLGPTDDAVPWSYRWHRGYFRAQVAPYCHSHDEWGTPLSASCVDACTALLEFQITSAGPDQVFRTPDDHAVRIDLLQAGSLE